MNELLKELAEKLGISTSFTYGCGTIKTSVVGDDVLRFFIESLGYGAKNDEEIRKSLERLEKRRWQKAAESVYVMTVDEQGFDLVLSEDEAKGEIEVSYAPEGNGDFSCLAVNFSEQERREEGHTAYVRLAAALQDRLAPGYYDVKIKTLRGEYKTLLAIAPKECYGLDTKGKGKLFGFAIQLYSLKSRRNWGVGDFTDLESMVDILANSGGDVIGLNPLNVLLHDCPESASPYASTSRLFFPQTAGED